MFNPKLILLFAPISVKAANPIESNTRFDVMSILYNFIFLCYLIFVVFFIFFINLYIIPEAIIEIYSPSGFVSASGI